MPLNCSAASSIQRRNHQVSDGGLQPAYASNCGRWYRTSHLPGPRSRNAPACRSSSLPREAFAFRAVATTGPATLAADPTRNHTGRVLNPRQAFPPDDEIELNLEDLEEVEDLGRDSLRPPAAPQPMIARRKRSPSPLLDRLFIIQASNGNALLASHPTPGPSVKAPEPLPTTANPDICRSSSESNVHSANSEWDGMSLGERICLIGFTLFMVGWLVLLIDSERRGNPHNSGAWKGLGVGVVALVTALARRR